MLLSLCLKEWRALRRDWHGLLVLFVMPAAFILIMSLALRDTFQTGLSQRLAWTWVAADTGGASRAVLDRLGGERRGVSADRASMLAELRENRAAIGLELLRAPGVRGNGPAVVIHARAGTHAPLVAEFAARVRQAWLETELEQLRAALPPGVLPDALAVGDAAALTEIRFARTEGAATSAVQQSVPAWLIFSMFFVVIPIANVLIAERAHGTLARLRSLGVPPVLLLAGKIVPFYVVGLAQTLLMLLVGRFVVPLLGGEALLFTAPLLPFVALASATSLAAIGFALLIASAARTTEQATTFGGVANILMGALGGVMVPKLVMPEAMQPWTALSPMAWALDAFVQLFARTAGPGLVATACLELLGFALACCLLGGWLLQRR